MKYKILNESTTGSKLTRLMELKAIYDEAALKIIADLGGEEDNYVTHREYIAGGIAGVKFPEKPEGWKSIGSSYPGYYYPLAKNKQALEKLDLAPEIKKDQINKILGFKEQWVGLTNYIRPGFIQCEKVWLMDVADECEFTPNTDMIEIMASEYKELQKTAKQDEN